MAVFRDNGWLQWRRAVLQHVADKRLSIPEYFLFNAIVTHADPASGVWEGSAEELSTRYPIPPRTCRDQLGNLERKGYIKRFPTPGKNGSYPILVNKFECTAGAMIGMRLNATKSTSSKHIIYESAGTSAAASAGTSAAHLIETSIETKIPRARAGPSTNHAYPPKPPPPSDAWMVQAPEPSDRDRLMAKLSQRLRDGKPVDPDLVGDIRAWEGQQLKKQPAAVHQEQRSNGASR